MEEKKKYSYPERECEICKCKVQYYNMSHHRKSKKHKKNELKEFINEYKDKDFDKYIDLMKRFKAKTIKSMDDIEDE